MDPWKKRCIDVNAIHLLLTVPDVLKMVLQGGVWRGKFGDWAFYEGVPFPDPWTAAAAMPRQSYQKSRPPSLRARPLRAAPWGPAPAPLPARSLPRAVSGGARKAAAPGPSRTARGSASVVTPTLVKVYLSPLLFRSASNYKGCRPRAEPAGAGTPKSFSIVDVGYFVSPQQHRSPAVWSGVGQMPFLLPILLS